MKELPIENAIELGLSPKATYLSTYERYGISVGQFNWALD